MTSCRRTAPLGISILLLALTVAAYAASGRGAPAGKTALVTVGSLVDGPAAPRAMPPGFIGFSFEYPALPAYAGPDPAAPNAAVVGLLRSLAAGQPTLRIGGDSADRAWWPIPGLPTPPGVNYALTPAWAAQARGLARAARGRLILDLNLESARPDVTAYEAAQLVRRIGARWIAALEIGNEPANYANLPYYQVDHRHIYARPRNYTFADFAREFARDAADVPRGLALAGPTVGGFDWLGHLAPFLRANPRVKVATFHRYPLSRCFAAPGSPSYATVPNLLAPFASRGFVAGLERYTAIAHRAGASFRLDEINSVSCGGKHGVSDTPAAALWAPDALFAVYRAGVDAVNFHTFPGAQYAPFEIRGAQLTPEPLLTGLRWFVEAAPVGSRLLTVRIHGPSTLRAWSTLGRDGRVRVLLINDALRAQGVTLRVAGGKTVVRGLRPRSAAVIIEAAVANSGRS